MAIVKEERIGNQRLILGDCLDVMPLLDTFDAVVTDPPYGIGFQSNHRSLSHKKIANDHSLDVLRWACEGHGLHSNYIWMRWDNLRNIPQPKSLVTWVKDNHSMGDLKHEHGRQTEFCAFYPGLNHYFPKGRPNDVIKAARTKNELHPTQKPVGLMEVVLNWTVGAVIDPFMGSGTTLVACQKLGRRGTGIELDPDYFEVACKRVDEAARQPDLFIKC
jgi:site-specific DNA-methyltransferase (adenine-specific)